MSKKIWIPLAAAGVVAVLAGIWATYSVSAKNPEFLRPFRRPRGILGQVSSISADQFTMTRRDGLEASFLVTDSTRFRSRSGEELNFTDLREDGWAAVFAPRVDQALPEARLVILMPAGFDPEKLVGVRGIIEGIDESLDQLTIRTKLGEKLVIDLGEDTLFKGQAQDLTGLEDGMWALIASEKQASGGLLADLVRSTYPLRRMVGEITDVNVASGALTILTRGEQREVTVAVDANTRFRSRDGSVSAIGDLKPGMIALVLARHAPGSQESTALFIGAAQPEDLAGNKRLLGKVVSVGSDRFTIEARDGQRYTFLVSEITRFLSRNRQLSSLAYVETGMILFVAGKDLGDGTYQAGVIALPRRPQP